MEFVCTKNVMMHYSRKMHQNNTCTLIYLHIQYILASNKLKNVFCSKTRRSNISGFFGS